MIISLCLLVRKDYGKMRASCCCLSLPSMATAQIRGGGHRWKPGTVSSSVLTQKPNSLSGARSWIKPRWIMPAKCLFARLDSMLPSHNNITGHSTDGEKANIEHAGQTNKSKVYLATCGPAG